MVYEIYSIENFDRELSKLSKEEQERVQKIFLQLKENPYVGDQLQIKILREKRLKEKRVYYLVFDEMNAVLMVAISDKKTQQQTINYIIRYIDSYRSYLRELLNKD